MNLVIPAAIATASAIAFQSKELQTRDTLFCQIAFLLGLMLYHNLLMIDIEVSTLQLSNDFHTNSTASQSTSLPNNNMNEEALDEIGHCYVTTILALFATLTCRGQNYEYSKKMRHSPYPAKQKISHLLNLVKVAIASVVPASLAFIYICLFVKVLGKNKFDENESTFYEDKHRGIHISKHEMSLVVFIFTWVSIIYWKTRRRQNKSIRVHNPALVPQTSIFDNLSRICFTKNNEFENLKNGDHNLSPNEKDWESWSNSDLIAWVTLLFKKEMQTQDPMTGLNGYKNDYRNKSQRDVTPGGVQIEIDDQVMLQTITILREQLINGSILPHIQVNDLVVMGVKYSYSIFLYVNFQKLIHSELRNMNTYDHDSKSGVGIDLDKWLGKKIGGNNDKSNSHSDSDQESDDEDHYSRSKIPQNTGLHDTTSLPQVSDANDIMSARFGMELPELKSPPGGDIKQSSIPIPRVNATALKPTSTQSASQTTPSLDPHLLQAMPPNIREIASRNPELVKALHEKFLFEKSQGLESQNVTNTREKLVRFQMDEGENVVAKSEGLNNYDEEAGEFNNSNYDNNNVNEFDDEMVGLLRRRSTNQRLKSG